MKRLAWVSGHLRGAGIPPDLAYVGCVEFSAQPWVMRSSACHAAMTSSVNQTVRLPHWRKLAFTCASS